MNAVSQHGRGGASFNYDFGAKNHWRRTLWNEILRRTQKRERELPIVYLAGRDDLDRELAIKKGVPGRNLIAVEKDSDSYAALRSRGIPCIQSDIVTVCLSWPDKRPVAAIYADFCCGIEYDNQEMLNLLERKPFRQAVLAINFQRGRDPFSNNLRRMLESLGMLGMHHDPKHRGFQFLAWHAIDYALCGCMPRAMFDDYRGQLGGERDKAHIPLPTAGSTEHRELISRAAVMLRAFNPAFFSYRSSSGVFMDSVVIQHPIGHYSLPESVEEQINAERAEIDDRLRDDYCARQITAMFAVRTRRSRNLTEDRCEP